MILLASRSPRRLQLLQESGAPCSVVDSGVDDSQLRPGNVSPEQWTMALAYLKARAAFDRQEPLPANATILGADTIVAKNGRIIGQPRDAEDARRTLHTLREGSHRVITGVALLRTKQPRILLVDQATVTVGPLPDDLIDAYIATEAWKGKAGSYNLFERTQAGWPLTVQGDPTTVVGLPMRLLAPVIAECKSRSATTTAAGGTTVRL